MSSHFFLYFVLFFQVYTLLTAWAVLPAKNWLVTDRLTACVLLFLSAAAFLCTRADRDGECDTGDRSEYERRSMARSKASSVNNPFASTSKKSCSRGNSSFFSLVVTTPTAPPQHPDSHSPPPNLSPLGPGKASTGGSCWGASTEARTGWLLALRTPESSAGAQHGHQYPQTLRFWAEGP